MTAEHNPQDKQIKERICPEHAGDIFRNYEQPKHYIPFNLCNMGKSLMKPQTKDNAHKMQNKQRPECRICRKLQPRHNAALQNTKTQMIKNRSMEPVLICPNITIVLNILFQEILALMRARHIVSSNRIIVQTKIN